MAVKLLFVFSENSSIIDDIQDGNIFLGKRPIDCDRLDTWKNYFHREAEASEKVSVDVVIIRISCYILFNIHYLINYIKTIKKILNYIDIYI